MIRLHGMTRRLPAAALGLAALSALAGLSACTKSTPGSPASSTPASTSGSASASAQPTAAATVMVVTDPATIGRFEAPGVTIAPGQSVQWVFQDANPHTATADDNSFTSPKEGLVGGQTFSHTFAAAGTYPYHCFIHPAMHGTVVVR